jgi:DNA-binding CsgD family transcriptional regulator
MVPEDQSERLKNLEKLTKVERKIFRLFCEGQEYKQIATTLNFAESNIRRYMREIRIKLDITAPAPAAKQRAELYIKYCSLIDGVIQDSDSSNIETSSQSEAAGSTMQGNIDQSPTHISRIEDDKKDTTMPTKPPNKGKFQKWAVFLLLGGILLFVVGIFVGKGPPVGNTPQVADEIIPIGTYTFTSGPGQESGRQEIPLDIFAPGRHILIMQNSLPDYSGTWLVWDYLALKSREGFIWEIGVSETPHDFSSAAFDEFCDPNVQHDCTAEFTVGDTSVNAFVKELNDSKFTTARINFEVTEAQLTNSTDFTLVLSTLYATHAGAENFQLEVSLDRLMEE